MGLHQINQVRLAQIIKSNWARTVPGASNGTIIDTKGAAGLPRDLGIVEEGKELM